MRNLRCISRFRHQLETHLPCTASAWDAVNHAILYTLGPSKGDPIIELRSKQLGHDDRNKSYLLASWDATCSSTETQVDNVVDLQYLVSSEIACLVLACGDIVTVRSAPDQGQDKIEIVGSVDAGISAAAWSPDEDLLVIATRANTLLFMTTDFDHVASTSFETEDTKLSKQVSVGWGKRETQFQGKRAKSVRDPTVPERVDEGTPSSQDDGSVTISWRGDGSLLAVNTIQPQSRRMIRVYSREGMLESVSEAVDGLEGSLAWKPSGQLLGSVQRRENDVQVVFFEHNGLRHGEFSLRLDDSALATWARRIKLAWNVDSTILAVSYCDRVQLWTMDNYHYYLKQEVVVPTSSGDEMALSPRWHPENPLILHILSMDAAADLSPTAIGGENTKFQNHLPTATVFSMSWSLPDAAVTPPHDLGMVTVIDGRTLYVTPLRIANVPPPMALDEITMTSPAVDVAISSNNAELAVLHHDSVSIYVYQAKLSSGRLKLINTAALPVDRHIVPSQISYARAEQVNVLMHETLTNCAFIHAVKTHRRIHDFHTKANAYHLLRSVDFSGYISMQDNNDAQLLSLDVNGDASDEKALSIVRSIPEPICEARIGMAGDEIYDFYMTSKGALYAGEQLLMRACTSFLLTQSHLLVTTSNHLLKFIHLEGNMQSPTIPPNEPDSDERCRNIERGAKLVAVMPSTYAVTLQMPRGNLETIYPRALVLAGVRKDIDMMHYKKAFLACRGHRVDLNILHDYKSQQFLSNIPLILQQFSKTEHIDLFLSQLSQEDVSITLYRNTLPQVNLSSNEADTTSKMHPGASMGSSGSKVNRVCNAFLNALQSDFKNHLQNIITAHVCKDPPDVEAGLKVIANLGDPDSDEVETAVEHICFLTDVNKLYDTALGMYDLELALAIAQQSQKDPREYLPYLQNLQSLSDNKKRFQIDDDLRRYTKALHHLHQNSNIDRFIAYAERHELYREALDLNRYDGANHSRILNVFASFLDSRNRFAEAAVVYESLCLYQEASTAYASAQMWQESLSCAALANISADAIQSLARSLAEGLLESKSYSAAATIFSDHLDNVSEAARAHCKGYDFASAIRLLALRGKHESISEVLDSGLAEAFSNLTELTSDCRTQLLAQVPRIGELREKKARDPLAFYEGTAEATEGADAPDDVSLAPSETSTAGGTLLTRYTGRNTGTVATGASRRTSKNRRREERKRARGKKGSVYEEEYLVNSVERLIEKVNGSQDDVHRTIQAMCRRGMWERAKTLEGGFAELVQGCEKGVSEVWGVMKTAIPSKEAEELGERPLGADGVLWDSLEEATKSRPPPEVKRFAGLMLLGKNP